MAGFAAATGMDFIRALENRDFEAAGKLFAEGGGQFALEATKRAGAAIAEGLTGSEGIIGMANRLFGQADNPFMEVLFESMAMRQFQYNFNFLAFFGTDFGTPWAEKMTGLVRSFTSSNSSTNIAPSFLRFSTTWVL